MRTKTLTALVLILILGLAAFQPVRATETENLGIHVLPAAKPPALDGSLTGWDLSGGVFACGDVENTREQYSVWFHAMCDAENLYLLARWIDPTPLNNPGQTIGGFGWNGDCLQVRFITNRGTADERQSNWTCWRGVDGADLMDLHLGGFGKKESYGRDLKDAKAEGGKQGFSVNPYGKGYVQAVAIPWKLLTADGKKPAGGKFEMTIEPNFTVGKTGRLSNKDIFQPGITPDRVFTFTNTSCWGPAWLEAKGNLTPRPVRLADAREFPVKLEKGVPVVDWTGLIVAKEIKGFKPIAFTMPEDGYLSLNILDKDGLVVRQLLNWAFYTKGRHEVKWDGLTTPNWRTPGSPVAEGAYTWEAIWHKGIGLKLRGWACNAGTAPWDSSPTSNWGGDQDAPAAVAADGKQVYLGWGNAEAGSSLIVCDLAGKVVWKNHRGGIAGASLIAMADGEAFILDSVAAFGAPRRIYKLACKDGSYIAWKGTDSPDLVIASLWNDKAAMPKDAEGLPLPPDGMAVTGGKLYVSFSTANTIIVADAKAGNVLTTISVEAPGALKTGPDGKLYILSAGKTVLALGAGAEKPVPVLTGLSNASALAVDQTGRLYVGLRAPDNQVAVYAPDGKPVATIGRKGGRTLVGKWTPDGMAFIKDLAIDAEGKLWVCEADKAPKRFSVWNTKTGALVTELFGSAQYGACGGAINPRNPDLMVGQSCAWKLDPTTGRGSCLGVITRGMENSRFGEGVNGKLYLTVADGWIQGSKSIKIFECVGEADYPLRSAFFFDKKTVPPDPTKPGAKETKQPVTTFWADENGDGQRQPAEEQTFDGTLSFSGWYMNMAPNLTIYAGKKQYAVTGFTPCGAPKYDLAKGVMLPDDNSPSSYNKGMGSADDRFMLYGGEYIANESWFRCYDVATGKLLWRYPDNFVGVHGSHGACPPEAGMIRGSFGPCGVVRLPEPIGNLWAIVSNLGEWHLLTEKGFYLTRLFQPDALKVQWPAEATPGVSMDNCPPGLGAEDFGGSMTKTDDGRLFVQSGKTAFWNLEVVGLETVKAMKGEAVTISAADVKEAQSYRDQFAQAATGKQQLTIALATPTFTGDLANDFKGAQIITYKKGEDAVVRAAAAYDAQHLYLAWEVKDATPWVNGANDATLMYIGGDTVDFQLATDPKADAKRSEAVLGDLRLSIGNFKGTPTAVVYRKVATEKRPKVFSSGVVANYPMDSVVTLTDARITVKPGPKGYVVEAAIPLAGLGLKPEAQTLRGDFGATYGNPAGRTRLRVHWNNQTTGLVDDAVYELMMAPNTWGELMFK